VETDKWMWGVTGAAVLVLIAAAGLATAENTTTGEGGNGPSVDQIVAHTNRVAYYQGADGRAQVTMTIADVQGRTRSREFTILRMDDTPEDTEGDGHCGEQRFYIYFQRPADVNKMAFLVWKHLDKDDDRWLYLPALDLVKRIAASDKRTSFVGSHFFYEDVSGRRVDDDVHELLETSEAYFVLKNTPRDPGSVEFSHFKMWIHRATFIPVKIEYFDKAGAPYRVYEVLQVADVDGFKTVTKAKMTDLTAKGYTLLEYSDVAYDLGLPENLFTERYLRRAPRKYLR